MDNFTPDWLEFKSQPINKTQVNKEPKVETNIDIDKFTETHKINIMEEINKNGLRPQYNSIKQTFKIPNTIFKKKKIENVVKKNNLDKSNEDDSMNIYSNVSNFVEKYYFTPKVKNNTEIYISSSEDDFSDIDEINYN